MMPLYFSQKYQNIEKNAKKILVLTALTVGLIWTTLELTPKSALLSLTILYFSVMFVQSGVQANLESVYYS
jgi:hypothetical protein